MADYYRSDLFILSKSFFGGWRVVERETGAKLVPSLIFQEKLGYSLHLLGKRDDILPDLREAALKLLCTYFCLASRDPSSPVADAFRAYAPAELVEMIIFDTRAVLAQFSPTATSFSPTDAPWLRAQRVDLGGGETFWSDAASRQIWAGYESMARPATAEPEDVARYWRIYARLLDEAAYGTSLYAIFALQKLMSRVILNHRRERDFFRDEAVDDVVQTLVLRALAKRDAR